MRWEEYGTQIGEVRNAYRVLVENSEGKTPLDKQVGQIGTNGRLL
jgi:hypothetical protein